MQPHILDNASVIYISDKSGQFVPFEGITSVPEIQTDTTEGKPYANISFDTDMSFSVALQTTIKKGQWHILCGIAWTGAAKRYIRSVKRRKEKQRRNSLKGKL